MKPTYLAAIAFGLISMGAGTAGLELPSPEATLVESPLLSGDCDHHCRTCSLGHDIVVAQENNHHADHLENCGPGSCESHECDGGGGGITLNEEPTIELWDAIRLGQPEPIRAVVSHNRDRIFYNQGRGAVQLSCAAGRLVASMPVSPEVGRIVANSVAGEPGE